MVISPLEAAVAGELSGGCPVALPPVSARRGWVLRALVAMKDRARRGPEVEARCGFPRTSRR